jgi:hypothetical protein
VCDRERDAHGGPGTHTRYAMARKPQISVEPRPGGKWAVQKDGTQRASLVTERKADAVSRARSQAQREKTELVIKKGDGTIQSKDSYGNDPRNVKG